MRRLWLVLAVVAAMWCWCRDKPTPAHTGIVLYYGEYEDASWALSWTSAIAPSRGSRERARSPTILVARCA